MATNHHSRTFSVITPTYKGRGRLEGVIRSLESQSLPALEWIVVMDGYDHETEVVALAAGDRLTIDVKVLCIERNHKKAAVNAGVVAARGFFCLIADDDDEFPPDAIEKLSAAWESLCEEDQRRCVGVTGLCVDEAGSIVGDRFPGDRFFASALECSLVRKVQGEKWGMQRTDLLRRFPFFEDAEGYVGESTVWFRIAEEYRTLYINEIVRIYKFNPVSIINSRYDIEKIRGNCQAWAYGYKHPVENYLGYFFRNPRFFFGCSVGYVRNMLHSLSFGKYRSWMSPLTSPSAAAGFLLGAPAALILFVRDRLRSA
jgi:glycosyltransferase involved in cell wall biosynthesis